MSIARIHAEWPLFMTSLSLGLHDGSAWVGSISIRSAGDDDDKDWKQSLSGFEHKKDYTLEQAQALLPGADDITWDPTMHDAMGRFEYRGASGPLRLWLSVLNPAFPLKADAEQCTDAEAKLDALKAEVWA